MLKFLGLPLKPIGTLLERFRDPPPEMQRRVGLPDKRNPFDKMIDAIATLPDWTQFTQIIRSRTMPIGQALPR